MTRGMAVKGYGRLQVRWLQAKCQCKAAGLGDVFPEPGPMFSPDETR